ncbi:DUF3889 domain-containing protein [Robertmurraya sp. DFI.2.37]|uniref:DUF3889 domain-containing protein n=1 Tax=Robertmurraya sp. DFI.2.37 TaxID=3031819 RepID=UPI0012455ABE|nr:DUF3889 domain-containing protein [Robertmurraya sp. DFI.2.37]MDF1507125.1 DUF3889 domain-containing protein [Robertmurraya sp. DFI.2.37]
MKKILISLILFSASFAFITNDTSFVEAEEKYAKWGQLAVSKTKEKYPNAEIKDYKHIGRVQGTNTTVEKFKLWLKENDKELGLLVNIEFDKETERVIEISFKEIEK